METTLTAKANKRRDEIINENTKNTKRLGFKITENQKTQPIINWILKRIRMQQVHVSSLHLNDALREKCRNTELFLVCIFLHLDYERVFSPKTGKYRPETTPYLGTFHAVMFYERNF